LTDYQNKVKALVLTRFKEEQQQEQEQQAQQAK